MRFGLLLMTGCCIALAGWIAILILTLPGHFTSRDWQTVWVGLDLAELAGFAATAWAAWHQRQVVTFFMVARTRRRALANSKKASGSSTSSAETILVVKSLEP